LSIVPVTTDANTGGSFNRYAYANNRPYKYTDPDGRNPWLLRASYEASYFVATRLGAGMLGSLIGLRKMDKGLLIKNAQTASVVIRRGSVFLQDYVTKF
jgi:hypothetical protein